MADRFNSSQDNRYNSNKCYTMIYDRWQEIEQKKMRNSCRNFLEYPKNKSPNLKILNETSKDSIEEKEEDGEEEEADEENDVTTIIQKHVDLVKSESGESDAESNKRKFSSPVQTCSEAAATKQEVPKKKLKISSEKDQMFEIFQCWALKTYGDQAKTKTITLKKKARILKALDGKEQNNPDSSKFRFWVKSKGFTTRIPNNFAESILNSTNEDTQNVHLDLYVASTTKDFGERTFRKVAVVEEFFNIIYNVHVELGGRGFRHAGQKRTYRIITETFAFLPREAVTKFLSGCPSCKKNLRAFSPSRFEEQFTESSSEFEALNYSSQNESSVDSTQLESIKPLKSTKKQESPLAKLSSTELTTSTTDTQKLNHLEQGDDIKISTEIVLRDRIKDFEEKSESDLEVEGGHQGDDDDIHVTSKSLNYSNKTNSLPINPINLQSGCSSSSSGAGAGGRDSIGISGGDNILNYYQFLKKFYSHPATGGWTNLEADLFLNRNKLTADNRKFPPSISPDGQYLSVAPPVQCSPFLNHLPNQTYALKDASTESTIDLTIKPIDKLTKRININIEGTKAVANNSNSIAVQSPCSTRSTTDSGIFINSVDVSINMSNNLNELKISCKTTPPKKRYSAAYKPEPVQTIASESIPKDENCAINLRKEFNEIETKCDVNKDVIDKRTMVKDYCGDRGQQFQVDLSKVKPITSTYLKMTRSLGLSDEDALKIDDLEKNKLATAVSDRGRNSCESGKQKTNKTIDNYFQKKARSAKFPSKYIVNDISCISTPIPLNVIQGASSYSQSFTSPVTESVASQLFLQSLHEKENLDMRP